jgi:hypothetical protein
MQEDLFRKGLVFAVIAFFICVSFQPIVAKDTISSEKKYDTKEFYETIKDIMNNKEIWDILEKYEIKVSQISFHQLFGRLQKEISNIIEKNEIFNKKIKQLSDYPCDCENENITWRFPFICVVLFILFLFFVSLWFNGFNIAFYVVELLWIKVVKIDCFWLDFIPPPPNLS